MIESVAQSSAQQLFNKAALGHIDTKQAFEPKELQGLGLPTNPVNKPESFGNLIGDLVKEVDAKAKVSKSETNKLLLGESDNIHQSMIAMQESGLAFTMLVEVRNKLVTSYQELMRMPV